jgi:cell division protein FtsN
VARDYKQRRRPRREATPGWVWFAAGLGLGLAVALGVHLRKPGPVTDGAPVASRSARPASQKAEEAGAEAEPVPESGFDFYTMLPDLEVVVPEEETRRSLEAGRPPAQPLAAGRYWIQAGSFRNPRDAERRKAELGLLGYASSVQSVDIQGQTWHRVRIGPLASAAEAEAARQRLADNGIGALAVRERG